MAFLNGEFVLVLLKENNPLWSTEVDSFSNNSLPQSILLQKNQQLY